MKATWRRPALKAASVAANRSDRGERGVAATGAVIAGAVVLAGGARLIWL